MRIDWHVHINDPKYMGPPWWQHPVPMSLENALEAHQLAALDRTVISNAVHYIRFCETEKEVLLPSKARTAISQSAATNIPTSSLRWRLAFPVVGMKP